MVINVIEFKVINKGKLVGIFAINFGGLLISKGWKLFEDGKVSAPAQKDSKGNWWATVIPVVGSTLMKDVEISIFEYLQTHELIAKVAEVKTTQEVK